jgi:hypothetical protein
MESLSGRPGFPSRLCGKTTSSSFQLSSPFSWLPCFSPPISVVLVAMFSSQAHALDLRNNPVVSENLILVQQFSWQKFFARRRSVADARWKSPWNTIARAFADTCSHVTATRG